MKKYSILFVLLGFLFSCSQKGEVKYVVKDSNVFKVLYNKDYIVISSEIHPEPVTFVQKNGEYFDRDTGMLMFSANKDTAFFYFNDTEPMRRVVKRLKPDPTLYSTAIYLGDEHNNTLYIKYIYDQNYKIRQISQFVLQDYCPAD